jgi:lipopolysaccharide/colanic/teichoic acid biosynthesis glycosyltransferase
MKGGHSLPRSVDVACAIVGLTILSPVFAMLALLVLLRDGRPVLFSQMRAGRYGSQFRIWKFRTMRCSVAGAAITAAGDPRVTETGAWLRRFKLDELPQLFNVLRGEMSLVGPRPEAPEYVNRRSPIWQTVLQARPGITDLATLLYRNEEELLRTCNDPDRFYRESVLPAKLRLNLAYLRTRSFRQDVTLIWLTICSVLSPAGFDPDRIQSTFRMGIEYGRYLHSVSPAVDW